MNKYSRLFPLTHVAFEIIYHEPKTEYNYVITVAILT